MPETVLSTGALNRALLERQLLLERSTAPLVDALEAVAGLQTQYAPSAYIGLWSRLAGFRRESLTRALIDREAVQATLMRATIPVVSRRDFRLFAAGIRASRREWWERVQKRALEGVDMDAAVELVRTTLRDGPRSQRELVKLLEEAGFPRICWSAAGIYVDMVRVPPSGTWERRRADLFALADEWLPHENVTEEDGVEHLVRRYIGGFGPAAVADIAGWAQVPLAKFKPVVERLDLVRYRDDAGRILYDLPNLSLTDPATPAPVRLLPTWDATLLVHARRAAIMPERFRPIVFSTKLPPSMPTFLVDGSVAGSWRFEDGRVTIEPFEELTRAQREEVEAEAGRIAGWH